MGYGALLADGCTVGGYLGGIASFSLHGWLWAGMALLGTQGGGRLIALLGVPALHPRRPDW
jgi:fructose-1,6-bisphosphatase/inositol monophosphatase family enzyme